MAIKKEAAVNQLRVKWGCFIVGQYRSVKAKLTPEEQYFHGQHPKCGAQERLEQKQDLFPKHM